jgi:hypothetical protein
MPRTQGTVGPSSSSPRGMPGVTPRTRPWIAGRWVRDCGCGPVVAGRPSRGCRHDPARAGPCTQVLVAIRAYETAEVSRLVPPCEPRAAVARLHAPSRSARPSGARPHLKSCPSRRAGSRWNGDPAVSLGALHRSREKVCPYFTLWGQCVPFFHAFGNRALVFTLCAPSMCPLFRYRSRNAAEPYPGARSRAGLPMESDRWPFKNHNRGVWPESCGSSTRMRGGRSESLGSDRFTF